MANLTREGRNLGLDLARVLVVDDNPTSRLTLQTVLEAGGYSVDAAATAAEAVLKLDSSVYELVLSDMQMESPDAGYKVLAHARMMDYQPAMALITAYHSGGSLEAREGKMLIAPEDVPGLLGTVANLIAGRVTKLLNREMRQARN